MILLRFQNGFDNVFRCRRVMSDATDAAGAACDDDDDDDDDDDEDDADVGVIKMMSCSLSVIKR